MPTFNSSGGSRGGARGTCPPPLFLDQNEAPGAKKNFFETGPPLSQGPDDLDILTERAIRKFEFSQTF